MFQLESIFGLGSQSGLFPISIGNPAIRLDLDARLQERDEVRPMDDNTIAGTPEQVAETLQATVEQGANRLALHFADAPCIDGTKLFTEQVLPQLA